MTDILASAPHAMLTGGNPDGKNYLSMFHVGCDWMFIDDRGYIKKKWMIVIAVSTVIIPIIGVVLWTMTFVGV